MTRGQYAAASINQYGQCDSTTTVTKNAAGNTTSNVNTTTNTIISDAPAVALGLSGTFGDVTLDTVISTGNTFLSQIALTYAWK
jgi:hypothetical protein